MAVIKFTNSKSSVKKIIDYITQPSKTEERLISGKDCMPESALSEMELIKSMYGKTTGRQYIHIVQSFDPKDELSHEKANDIGVLLAERFNGFQAVVATHKDRNHVHNHIVLNSVNFETGLKFQQSKKDMQDVKDFSDKLCLENGLSIIEKPQQNTDIKMKEYQAAMKGTSWKFALILAIDEAIKNSENKQDFISNMNRLGYDTNWTDTRKYITYTTPDGKKCRDNKLHDNKYLKESMENEFRKSQETTRTITANQSNQTQRGSKPNVGRYNSNQDRNSTNTGRNREPKKKSIQEQLANNKAKIKYREEQKRLSKNDTCSNINQYFDNYSLDNDTLKVKKRSKDMEI